MKETLDGDLSVRSGQGTAAAPVEGTARSEVTANLGRIPDDSQFKRYQALQLPLGQAQDFEYN